MVILISALFALCWLPLLILINVIPEFYPNINSWRYILYLWWFAHGLAMLHSIVNPVIYFIRNARFREGFCYFSSKLLPCIAFKEFRLLTDNNTSRRSVFPRFAEKNFKFSSGYFSHMFLIFIRYN
ncbi:hypothetical protein CRE_15262 [Caenorhabditis remanei]|uniref:G-protein coupled receptors family 1 profile domain-containing protein n=1 Tax=Caenorhabditis remanei TaxID=31234 RepID=E3NWW7_CAERE|nr:hypothetical protein CRE_15262 [Caenorhabditis remanei]